MADRVKLVSRPWQPQDLIDDLQSIIDEEPNNYLNTRRTTLCMARDYLKEHFAEQKWIPVSERLPETFGEYIVAVKHISGEMYSDYADYDPYAKSWKPGIYSGPCDKITHWMPLPEPPKEDKHE